MSDRLRLRAYAKINFYLDVLGRRPDGYHNLETVFQSISLCDEIEIRRSQRGLGIWCDHPDVPRDDSNVAMKAAAKLLETVKGSDGFEIRIHKQIPVAAGLAGGSADAAAVLVGMNELLQLGHSVAELQQIGAQVGADIPFCLQGGTALGRGIGDQLEALPPVAECPIIIANPGFPVPTAWAFRQLNFGLTTSGKNVTILTQGLETRNWVQVSNSLYNAFQPMVVSHYPMVGELLERLAGSGAVGTLMTGSGPTVFGLVPEAAAHVIVQSLTIPYCKVTQTCDRGVEIL